MTKYQIIRRDVKTSSLFAKTLPFFANGTTALVCVVVFVLNWIWSNFEKLRNYIILR
jgi:hypothetical protein